MGEVRGTVLDDITGETLIGVNVIVAGTYTGASTDLDGKFSIQLAPGTYQFECSYISYAKLVVSEVIIKANEVTILNNLRLKQDAIQADEVVITATISRNNETAMATMQKKSANVMDGISSQTFKKVGDGDAGAAIKRVTGVSVEGGKYVYVRGLGDRYTKTTLNGMEIPGLDPDRNSIQLDIFPTNLIDNLSVFKTFTADLSADFSGGSVDIVTKDFPDQKKSSISASLGYNPAMNLNSEFLSYESSGADYIGLGAQSRAIPIDRDIDLAGMQYINPTRLENLSRQFDPIMATSRKTSLLNTSLGYSTGNQINKDNYTFGYNIAANYSISYKYYDDFIISEYATDADRDKTELRLVKKDEGEVGQEEVFWSGFVSGSIKKRNSSLSLALMHLQNGTKQASLLDAVETGYPSNQPLDLQKHVLYYNQRSISNVLLTAKHFISDKDIEVTLKTAPTLALNKEPDFRQTVFAIDQGNVNISGGNGGLANRIYRDLQEISVGNRLDIKKTLKIWSGEDAIFKFGAAYTYKNRDFDVISYRLEEEGGKVNYIDIDPNQILSDGNVFDAQTRKGVRVEGVEQANNVYTSRSNNIAAYVSGELPISNIFKVIGGLRVEQFSIFYTGQKQVVTNPATDIFKDDKVLDELNFLPSVGLVYTVGEDMNLRLNYSKTLARPSFKEKSGAEIIDALTGRSFFGNLDVKQTNISNYDVRWEKFFKGGELVSVSAFYKNFINPIEIVAYDQTAPSSVTPRNSAEANLFGVELDARKNLGFINSKLSQYTLGANFTYVHSRLDRKKIFAPGPDGIIGTEDDLSEYDERVLNKRNGETIDQYRTLQGQSPYVVNAFVAYKNDSLGFELNVSYNVQCKRLAIVGIARNPNVYEQPFHSLNFKASKSVGKDDRMNISFTAENILNDKREKLYEAYQAENQIFSSFSPQRLFTVGFAYSF